MSDTTLSDLASIDAAIRSAIRERRMISFVLDGEERIAEPHDYGVIHGGINLFCYQIAGKGRSSAAIGWRWAALDKISNLQILDRRFAGPRKTKTGKHKKWNSLFASVSRSVDR